MHTYCTVLTLSWKKKSPSAKIIMPLTNRELFKKARLSDFKPDASLVSFIFEQKGHVGPIDDVDQVMVDHILDNFLKLAKKKWNQANSRARKWKRSSAILEVG